MKQIILIGTLFLCGLPFLAARAENDDASKMSSAERAALITETNNALNDFVQASEKGDSKNIPMRFWGPAILRLKPLRVTYVRANAKIVLIDDERSEAGFYVSVPHSSHALIQSDFAELVLLRHGEDKVSGALYRYRSAKPHAH